jgi:hypothetical protein
MGFVWMALDSIIGVVEWHHYRLGGVDMDDYHVDDMHGLGCETTPKIA